MLRFGKCLVCDEKDKRIQDLLAQIDDLKRFAYPPKTSSHLPIVEIEANKILDSASEPVTLDSSEFDSVLEANQILTGSYN